MEDTAALFLTGVRISQLACSTRKDLWRTIRTANIELSHETLGR